MCPKTDNVPSRIHYQELIAITIKAQSNWWTFKFDFSKFGFSYLILRIEFVHLLIKTVVTHLILVHHSQCGHKYQYEPKKLFGGISLHYILLTSF